MRGTFDPHALPFYQTKEQDNMMELEHYAAL
jgi:hypothetical protein